MFTSIIHRTLNWGILMGLVAAPFLCPPVLAQAPIQSQDANAAGIVAELIECKREDGVLTLKVRFRNGSDKPVDLHVVNGRNYDMYYVTAASKKYFILRDTEKNPLSPHDNGTGSINMRLAKGDTYVWWAKYPAPPADVKKISYYMPIAPPFDNVPIKD